jgi:UDPglucose 6-dehydrogenase
MKISVVGTGHVGLVTAVCFAHVGHDVLGVDDDDAKIARIASGDAPFYEPGLTEMLRTVLKSGKLRVSADVAEAARHGDVVFICVGTPTKPTGEADLAQVQTVAREVAGTLDHYVVLVEKSTVPVGTGEMVRRAVEAAAPQGAEFDVASNPEFLQEGYAIRDTLEPHRIVFGSDSERALAVLDEAYRPIYNRTDCPVIRTDIATAELIKHTSNAFLGMKISFINKVAEVCEAAGADVEILAAAVGLDPRIGREFLRAGIGYGGACLPKDVRAFTYAAEQLEVDASFLRAVDDVNRAARARFVKRITEALRDVRGKRIALWGLAFKPETDDMRHAPAIDIAAALIEGGAQVVAHDPEAMTAARSAMPPGVVYAVDQYEAALGAHCVAICTEWDTYASTDLARLREAMAEPLIVDGRNVFDPSDISRRGFRYLSVGRPEVRPAETVEPAH